MTPRTPHTTDTSGLALERDALKRALRRADLRYVSREDPGLGRRRRGKGFSFHDHRGRAVRDRRTLERVRAIVIPPAWKDVWICRDPRGHLQAVGRDDAGRLQYRYHESWTRVRGELKWDRLLVFAESLPRVRGRVDRDLSREVLDRRRVIAAAVRLLDLTLMRPGHEAYTREHGSRGLTTLDADHVEIHGADVHFRFIGKSGQDRDVEAADPRVAGVLRACRRLPDSHALVFRDNGGEPRAISADDINAYLDEATGRALTAKHFRAWGGTVLAAIALAEEGRDDRATRRKRQVAGVVKGVAQRLGNKPATARRHYIHPGVIDAFEAGRLGQVFPGGSRRARSVPRRGLSTDEKRVLSLLGGG